MFRCIVQTDIIVERSLIERIIKIFEYFSEMFPHKYKQFLPSSINVFIYPTYNLDIESISLNKSFDDTFSLSVNLACLDDEKLTQKLASCLAVILFSNPVVKQVAKSIIDNWIIILTPINEEMYSLLFSFAFSICFFDVDDVTKLRDFFKGLFSRFESIVFSQLEIVH